MERVVYMNLDGRYIGKNGIKKKQILLVSRLPIILKMKIGILTKYSSKYKVVQHTWFSHHGIFQKKMNKLRQKKTESILSGVVINNYFMENNINPIISNLDTDIEHTTQFHFNK